jgi:signal transduction histidine kinase
MIMLSNGANMGLNLSAFLLILTKPPADLIYHLVVSLAIILTGGIALYVRKESPKENQSHHTLIGCSILLLLQILIFGLRFINPNNFPLFPLIERSAGILTVVWLIWTFAFDDKLTILTVFNIILSIALSIIVGVSLLINLNSEFILSLLLFIGDLLWQCIAIGFALIGILLAVMKRPHHWGVMILILILISLGHIFQILLHGKLQYTMGAVRLAHTLSLPWVLTLIQRCQKDQDRAPLVEIEKPDGMHEQPVDTKPALIDLLLKINITQSGEEKKQAIMRALSLSVVADVSYLIGIPEETDKLHIIAGYDLIREVDLKPDTLVREDLPQIMTAWQANQALVLSQTDSGSRDRNTLAMLLKYHEIGNLFAYPLGLADDPLVGGIIFLSPYTGKEWGERTRQLMDEIQATLSKVLFMPDPHEETWLALNQTQLQVDALSKQHERLRQALTEKESLINEKENIIKELKARYQIEKMETVSSQERMKARIIELTTQLSIQQNVLNQLEQLKTEIRQLTSEREQLNLALSRANTMVKDLQTQTGQTGPIRLSIDSQIISLDSIAANVRLRVATPLAQKNIDLEINNPDGRQMIKTDPELLQTALLELLTNAIIASQPGGTIRLDQKLSLEMGMLTIQVTDFGDGLTQTEQSDLFSGQHETIPGIGNVESIRAAIRAIRVLNGKIWLKSKKASYTTFRVQIPVRIID